MTRAAITKTTRTTRITPATSTGQSVPVGRDMQSGGCVSVAAAIACQLRLAGSEREA